MQKLFWKKKIILSLCLYKSGFFCSFLSVQYILHDAVNAGFVKNSFIFFGGGFLSS